MLSFLFGLEWILTFAPTQNQCLQTLTVSIKIILQAV
jgi:hypothetical protein